MKNIIRFAVAGALMAGYATVQAQALPSTDNSDLYLFVSDQAAGTTFAEDTGVSIDSLLPSTDMSSGASLTPVAANSIDLAASSALTAYINAANSAGQTLEWGVEAAQFPAVPTGAADRPQGVEVALADTTLQTTKITGMTTGDLQTWASGFSGDTTFDIYPVPAGGAVYAFSAGNAAGNVWGSSGDSTDAGSVNEYGAGPDSTVALGTAATFYGVTANGGTGKLESYVLGGANSQYGLSAGQIELTANGTLVAGAPASTVPLPPAVWLLGSGLLGLAGVGRRRAV